MLMVHSSKKGGRSIELNTLVVTVSKRVEEVYIETKWFIMITIVREVYNYTPYGKKCNIYM